MTPTQEILYEARGAALELFDARDLEILAEGPARTGKTRGQLEKAYAVAIKYPGSRILLTRKTRASMSESVLQTLEDFVFEPNWRTWGGVCSRSHRETYKLPNGSLIACYGKDHTAKIMSTEWDRAFAFEWTEASETDHEEVLSRLSHGKTPFHQLCTDCNPQHPSHWLNQRANRRMRRIRSTHKDNPKFWTGSDWTLLGREYVLGTLDALTGVRRLRLKDGIWAAAEGAVYYPDFDASVHVIDKMPEGWRGWRKIRAIDFGFVDPFVCQWWADSGEALYKYREIYMSGRIVEDHAKQIVELSKGEEYVATVSDHDAEDRKTLERHGVSTTPAKKDISTGIDAVRTRLKVKPNGRRGLYELSSALVEIDRKLEEAKRPTSGREEWDAYLWAKRQDGQTKDVPIDRDNHGMDAMRYAVMAAHGGGGGYWGSVQL